MNAPAYPIAQIHAALPDLDWVTDYDRIAYMSQDYSWNSRPEATQIKAESCVKKTMRAGGPPAAWQGPEWKKIRRQKPAPLNFNFQPGQTEQQKSSTQARFRLIPGLENTVLGQVVPLHGGIGSINYGPLAARGNVLALRAITIEKESKFIELRGAEALLMHHLWGDNGLASAHDWLENLVTFASFDDALEFGNAMAHAPGIVKRELGFLGAPMPGYMKSLAAYLPAGCSAMIVLVGPPASPRCWSWPRNGAARSRIARPRRR